MAQQRDRINHTLVTLFNDILRIEERALTAAPYQDLSVREMHVLEAIDKAGAQKSMSAVAQLLHITLGSLTVSVSTLKRKGYVERERSAKDRRVVTVRLTEKGGAANLRHRRFHEEMCDAVMGTLPAGELTVLIRALERIDTYFSSKERTNP